MTFILGYLQKGAHWIAYLFDGVIHQNDFYLKDLIKLMIIAVFVYP